MCQNNYNTNKRKFKQINYTERTQIERWYNIEKKNKSEIGRLLHRPEGTIRREIKRGLVENKDTQLNIIMVYSADVSQKKIDYNKTGKGPNLKIGNNYKLKEYIEKGIKKERKSPEILIAYAKQEKLEFWTEISAKTIRNYIHKGGIFEIKTNEMIYRKIYKEKNRVKYVCNKVPADRSIDFREAGANERTEYGHWEGDLVIGQKTKGSVLFTLTERKTREEIIMKIEGKKAIYVVKALDELERRYKEEFKEKFKTITFDNGGEFRDYIGLEKSCNSKDKEKRVKVYYAHPYRSGERGSNENNNRLIRRFIPKGTDLTNITEEYIQWVEDWINNLLRPMFNFKSSLQVKKSIIL